MTPPSFSESEARLRRLSEPYKASPAPSDMSTDQVRMKRRADAHVEQLALARKMRAIYRGDDKAPEAKAALGAEDDMEQVAGEDKGMHFDKLLC